LAVSLLASLADSYFVGSHGTRQGAIIDFAGVRASAQKDSLAKPNRLAGNVSRETVLMSPRPREAKRWGLATGRLWVQLYRLVDGADQGFGEKWLCQIRDASGILRRFSGDVAIMSGNKNHRN